MIVHLQTCNQLEITFPNSIQKIFLYTYISLFKILQFNFILMNNKLVSTIVIVKILLSSVFRELGNRIHIGVMEI